MADNTAAALTTTSKKKRKTELERLLEGQVPNTDAEDNPWTAEEKLEMLKVQEGEYAGGEASKNVKLLHRQMEIIRNKKGEPQKPMRKKDEWLSKIRELHTEGATIESFEAEINPPKTKGMKKKAAQ